MAAQVNAVVQRPANRTAERPGNTVITDKLKNSKAGSGLPVPDELRLSTACCAGCMHQTELRCWRVVAITSVCMAFYIFFFVAGGTFRHTEHTKMKTSSHNRDAVKRADRK